MLLLCGACCGQVANVVLKTPQRKFEEGAPGAAAGSSAAVPPHEIARRSGVGAAPGRAGRSAGAVTARGGVRPPPFA